MNLVFSFKKQKQSPDSHFFQVHREAHEKESLLDTWIFTKNKINPLSAKPT